jgi:hypothetical protein
MRSFQVGYRSVPPTSLGQFIAIEFTPRCGGVLARIVSLFVFSWMSYLTISSGLSFIDQDTSPTPWRFPIAFQIILLVVLFATVWWFPESLDGL